MILEKIELINDIRTLKKENIINFHDNVTIVVGDNGSGKSTLLSIIKHFHSTEFNASQMHVKNNVKLEQRDDVNYKHVCLNKDLYANLRYFSNDTSLQIQCMGSSTGQGLLIQLKSVLSKEYDLLILDEPERGLSISKQNLIKKMIAEYIERFPQSQVIITTHCIKLMELKRTVLMIPDMVYMNTNEVEHYFENLDENKLGDYMNRPPTIS